MRPTWIFGLAASVALVGGCPGDDGSGDDGAAETSSSSPTDGATSMDGGDGSGTGTPGTSGMDETAGPATDGSGTGGDEGSLGAGHGIIRLQFQIADGEAGDPYAGTTRVSVTLSYLECLTDFYAANPDWAQAGTEGEAVFMAAAGPDGLCAIADANAAPCSVLNISQNVEVAQALAIEYTLEGELAGNVLAFGPLPVADLAACSGGTSPVVRLGSNMAVRGFDAAGTQLWETKSFAPDQASTDQGPPITINAGVPN